MEDCIDKLVWILIEAGREGKDDLDQVTMGEVRAVALTRPWAQRTSQVFFNTTMKEKEARHFMLLKTLMDGSLDKDIVAALQTEDMELVQMLKEEKLVLYNGMMMKEGRKGLCKWLCRTGWGKSLLRTCITACYTTDLPVLFRK